MTGLPPLFAPRSRMFCRYTTLSPRLRRGARGARSMDIPWSPSTTPYLNAPCTASATGGSIRWPSRVFGAIFAGCSRRRTLCVRRPRTAATLLREMGFRAARAGDLQRDRHAALCARPDDRRRRARSWAARRPTVLYTGRLDAEKDMDTWLRAAARRWEVDAHLVIGGEGTDAASVWSGWQPIWVSASRRYLSRLSAGRAACRGSTRPPTSIA